MAHGGRDNKGIWPVGSCIIFPKKFLFLNEWRKKTEENQLIQVHHQPLPTKSQHILKSIGTESVGRCPVVQFQRCRQHECDVMGVCMSALVGGRVVVVCGGGKCERCGRPFPSHLSPGDQHIRARPAALSNCC